jgi:hypothetical protein
LQQTLQREWPSEYKNVTEAFRKLSGESTSTGATLALAVRNKKRKVTNDDEGRVPVPISSSSTPKPSTTTATTRESQPVQKTLAATWGDTTKITATRQATIDYYLLQFIVCCAVAFSIVDSGFFIDFIAIL